MALSGDLPTLNADVAGDATATATAALDGDHAAAAAVDGDASTYWSPPPALRRSRSESVRVEMS